MRLLNWTDDVPDGTPAEGYQAWFRSYTRAGTWGSLTVHYWWPV